MIKTGAVQLRPVLIAVLFFASALQPAGVDPAAVYLAAAQNAIEAQNSQEAKAQIALAIKANPSSAQAWLMLAVVESQLGEPNAIPHYQKALSLAPNSFSGHYNLALAYLRQHQLVSARTHLEKAVALNPDQPDAEYNLGVVLLELKRPAEAETAFRRARTLQPDRPDVAFNRVRAEIAAGHVEAARAQVQEMDAGSLQPAADDARRLLAGAYLEKRQPDVVLDLIPKPQSPEDSFLRGAALFEQRRLTEAVREAATAVDKALDEPRYLLLEARILQALGQQEQVLELLQRASHLMPNSPDIYYSMAVSYYFERRYDEARRSLDQSLKLRPAFSRSVFLYAVTLVNEGMNREAISYLRRAVLLEPDNARYRFHLGTALARDNRPPEAKLAFENAVRLKPNYALAHYELGKVLASTGEETAAIREYEKAIEYQQDLAQAYYQLGRVASKLGQVEKSTRALEQFKAMTKHDDDRQQLAADVNGELQHP
jgi:tetratricopeptide (TPR) repeat protein